MCFVKLKPGTDKVFSKEKIYRDRTLSVTILGKNVNLATDKRISSLSGLETLLMNLNSTPICRGNTSFEDLTMNTTVFENSGEIAYVETGYGTPSTILEDNSSTGTCFVCSHFMSNLFRWRRRKSESSVLSLKRPNISLTSASVRAF